MLLVHADGGRVGAPAGRVPWRVLVVGVLVGTSAGSSEPPPKSESSAFRSGQSPGFDQVRLVQLLDAAAVKRALTGARRRLEEPRCTGSGTMALSAPGELVVRICPAFAWVGDTNPRYAEVIVLTRCSTRSASARTRRPAP
jgi:hypothetical protein